MLFRTTDAHEKLRAEIRAFAESEVKPQAFLMDKETASRRKQSKKWVSSAIWGCPIRKNTAAPGWMC